MLPRIAVSLVFSMCTFAFAQVPPDPSSPDMNSPKRGYPPLPDGGTIEERKREAEAEKKIDARMVGFEFKILDPKDDPIVALRKRRYNALLNQSRQLVERIAAGKEPQIMLLDALRNLYESELALTSDPAERVAILKRGHTALGKVTAMAKRLIPSGTRPAQDFCEALAAELHAEIELRVAERAMKPNRVNRQPEVPKENPRLQTEGDPVPLPKGTGKKDDLESDPIRKWTERYEVRKPDPKDDPIVALRKARYNALRSQLLELAQRIGAGRESQMILLGAVRNACEAELPLAADPAERVAILRKRHDLMKSVLMLVKELLDAGVRPTQDFYEAEAETLDAEIQLRIGERELRAKKEK